MESPDRVGVDAGSLPAPIGGTSPASEGNPLTALTSTSPSNWPLIEIGLSLQSKAVISESQTWLDLARQSRLRIENMRTMHRLAFSSARTRWVAQAVEESYKTGRISMCNLYFLSHD